MAFSLDEHSSNALVADVRTYLDHYSIDFLTYDTVAQSENGHQHRIGEFLRFLFTQKPEGEQQRQIFDSAIAMLSALGVTQEVLENNAIAKQNDDLRSKHVPEIFDLKRGHKVAPPASPRKQKNGKESTRMSREELTKRENDLLQLRNDYADFYFRAGGPEGLRYVLAQIREHHKRTGSIPPKVHVGEREIDSKSFMSCMQRMLANNKIGKDLAPFTDTKTHEKIEGMRSDLR